MVGGLEGSLKIRLSGQFFLLDGRFCLGGRLLVSRYLPRRRWHRLEHAFERNIQELVSEASHCLFKILRWHTEGVVTLERGHRTGELFVYARCVEIKSVQHQRHYIPLQLDCGLDLPAQPVAVPIALFER